MPNECREFYDMPSVKRQEEFKSYPLEKQFGLYSCGMRIEPPQMGFAWVIARRGEEAIPFLVDKLNNEKSEPKQKDIILIFDAMSQEGHLHDRQDVIDLIRRIVSDMKLKNIKEWSEDMLNNIEKNSSQ